MGDSGFTRPGQESPILCVFSAGEGLGTPLLVSPTADCVQQEATRGVVPGALL